MIDANATDRAKYGPAMRVRTQQQADRYLQECIEHRLALSPGLSAELAEAVERQQILYYLAHCDDVVRDQLAKFYEKPNMTALAELEGEPSPEQVASLAFVHRVTDLVDKLRDHLSSTDLILSSQAADALCKWLRRCDDVLRCLRSGALSSAPLHCPYCNKRHIDSAGWALRPHLTHVCIDDAAGRGCGMRWQLFDYVFGAPIGDLVCTSTKEHR